MEAFAHASGDVNPLHVDPAFARRSPFGECLVHGCLLALGMLGCVESAELAAARRLRVSFAGPLTIGASARVSATASDRGWEVKAAGGGRLLARLRLSADDGEPADVVAALPGLSLDPLRSYPAESAGDPRGVDYSVTPELRALAGRLGAGSIPDALLNGLAWASYVAGMEVPGLHGLLTGVSLAVSGSAGGASGGVIATQGADERTGRIVVMSALSGEFGVTTAEIESFARSAPRAPAVGLLQPAERSQPSRDGAVVVIGASRGLGASLALALAMRQCDVSAVYAHSTDAANELSALAGDDAARLVMHRADATDSAEMDALAETLRASGRPLQAIVLAAAPPPGAMTLAADGAAALVEYVDASMRLVATPLASLLPVLDPGGTVVFCSSVAVTAPPRDWPHYTAAKRAIEGLAEWFAAANPEATAVVARLPKMLTDMTNTPAGRIGAVPVEPVARWLAETVLGEAGGPGLVTLEAPASVLAEDVPA